MNSPPRKIPQELLEEFTLNGQIPVQYSYKDNSNDGIKGTFSSDEIDSYIEKAQRRMELYYGATDSWLYEALEAFPLEGMNIVVMGSQYPWYEAIGLAFGAQHVTTIEYNHIASTDPRVTALTPEQYKRSPKRFDAAFSISSFEHDGLGRYGDPINPSADLEAMQFMRQVLKPEGLLFVAVPMGPDLIVFNRHRFYGPLRFPIFCQNWSVVTSYGFDTRLYDHEPGKYHTQPIHVLRNSDPLEWETA